MCLFPNCPPGQVCCLAYISHHLQKPVSDILQFSSQKHSGCSSHKAPWYLFHIEDNTFQSTLSSFETKLCFCNGPHSSNDDDDNSTNNYDNNMFMGKVTSFSDQHYYSHICESFLIEKKLQENMSLTWAVKNPEIHTGGLFLAVSFISELSFLSQMKLGFWNTHLISFIRHNPSILY